MTYRKRTFNPGDAIAFTTGTGRYAQKNWYPGIVIQQHPAITGGPDKIEIYELTFGTGQQVPFWSDAAMGQTYMPFLLRKAQRRHVLPNRKDRIQPARYGVFVKLEEFNRDQRHREYQASAEARRAENISIGQNAIADELIWAANEGRGTLLDTLEKFLCMSAARTAPVTASRFASYGEQVRDDYLAGVNQTR